MCCFGRKRSHDHVPPARLVKPQPLRNTDDDLSDAFQSLSIEPKYAASPPSTVAPPSLYTAHSTYSAPSTYPAPSTYSAPSIYPPPRTYPTQYTYTTPITQPAPSVTTTQSFFVPTEASPNVHSPPSVTTTQSSFVPTRPSPTLHPPSTATTTQSSFVPVPKRPSSNIPYFPLRSPRCRHCGWIPKYRDKVLPTNPNGNADRPYYKCVKCKQNASPNARKTGDRIKGWITWDDHIGISPENRPCFCAGGYACRQDMAGVDSFYPGGGFWTCATGSCNFLSFRRDALTDDEAYKRGAPQDGGFEPWLL
ncbi:MAG: hypothetical protein Q9220_004778 [cf. Caloplaca sp. 1 TL-2023]